MAKLLTTVQNIVDQVRSQIDEQDQDAVGTQEDILPSINRGQDYAFDILARKYPEPLIAYTTLDLVAKAEYDIPEDVFEDRIEKIEISIPGGSQIACQRISYRDISEYESSSKANIPYYYVIIGRKIRFVPQPTGTYDARVWYLRAPEQLVLPQGRVTLTNEGANYVLVDTPGDDLSTEADLLEAYVNLVDGQSGAIKGTLQIQSISGNRVTFRTTPTRAKVLNRPIATSLAGLGAEADDYLASVVGSCVPYYARPTTNFVIQFAVAEIVRKLGGQAVTEESILEKFEKQVERTWVGREQTLRVGKKNKSWQPFNNKWNWDY